MTTNISVEMSLSDLQVCLISPIVPHTQVERLPSPIVPMPEQTENNRRAYGEGVVKRRPRVRVEMVFYVPQFYMSLALSCDPSTSTSPSSRLSRFCSHLT
jgi:hypothetical protein